MNKALLSLVIAVAILGFYAVSNAGSIILPFWQNTYATSPTYTMMIVVNTSGSTGDTVGFMCYGATGNPQAGSEIERTIAWGTQEIFGTGAAPVPLTIPTGDDLGYAVLSDTDGLLIAIGIVYDDSAKSGYPIACWKGNDDGEADPGW